MQNNVNTNKQSEAYQKMMFEDFVTTMIEMIRLYETEHPAKE